jgi:hypothetical protein
MRRPGTPPSDPMDRILIATTRDLAAMLMTRDREIIAYGEQGNVNEAECWPKKAFAPGCVEKVEIGARTCILRGFIPISCSH